MRSSHGSMFIAALLSLSANAAPLPKKEEPVKGEPKPQRPVPRVPALIFPELDDFFKDLPPGFAPMQVDDLRKQLEEMRKIREKALEDLARAMQKGGIGAGRVPAAVPGKARIIRSGIMHEGRLGAMVEVPTPTLIEQLDLPKEQGMVVNDVLADSAAAKAGMKPHDILLELDGKVVSSKIEDFQKQVDAIKPNTPIDAVVMRKGKKESVKGLSLPEASAEMPKVPKNPRGRPINPLVPGR